jgi:hypothetical protein
MSNHNYQVWDKEIVKKHLGQEVYLSYNIKQELRMKVPPAELKKALIATEWKKDIVEKYMNKEERIEKKKKSGTKK